MLQREMWQISENVEFPPASLDASIVDCRRVADEIPQNFRSQEWKAEPFCIETFQQQEESLSFGFENEQQTTKNLKKPQIEFATHYDDDFSSSWINQSGNIRPNFVEEISEDIISDQVQFEDQYFDNYVPLLSEISLKKDLWNFCDRKDATVNYLAERTDPKSELLRETNEEAYPIQGNTPIDIYPGTGYTSSNNYYQRDFFLSNLEHNSTNNMQDCSAASNELQEICLPVASSPAIIGSLPNTEQTQGFSLNQSCCINNISAPNQFSNLSYNTPAPAEQGGDSLKSTTNNCYSEQQAAGALQQCSGYNLYTQPSANFQKFSALPIVGGEPRFSQSSRDNPGIKFHIRTITHCEVECPAPGNLPLHNQAASFIPAGNPQGLSGGSGGQYFTQLKHMSDAICNSDVSNCNSWKENNGSMRICDNLVPQSTADIEVSHSNQVLPFQSAAYTNPFQNGVECPRLLVHEQRQTSILIGFPKSSNGLNGETSMETLQPSRDCIPVANCRQTPQQSQNELQYRDQAELNNNQQPRTELNHLICQPSPAAVAQGKENIIRTKCASQPIENDHSATQMSDISSRSGNVKPCHINSSYSPVFKFSPHSFSCLPSNPSWLSAKQSYSKLTSPTNPLECIMPPAVNFNGNYKVRTNPLEHGFFDDKYSSAFDPSLSQQFRNPPWTSRACSKDISEKNTKISSKKRNAKKSNKTEQKNLECSRCSKRFAKERDLQVHVNKHHLQMVKPYFCAFCSKNFKRPDQLKRHEKIHTGERPHLCSVCGRKFARTDHRNTHLKKHATSGLDKFSTGRKYSKADLTNGRLSKNEANKTTSPRSFEESSISTKDSFLIPMRFNPVPGPYPPYFISHSPLYDNQLAQSYVPAVHQ